MHGDCFRPGLRGRCAFLTTNNRQKQKQKPQAAERSPSSSQSSTYIYVFCRLVFHLGGSEVYRRDKTQMERSRQRCRARRRRRTTLAVRFRKSWKTSGCKVGFFFFLFGSIPSFPLHVAAMISLSPLSLLWLWPLDHLLLLGTLLLGLGHWGTVMPWA